MSPLSVSAQQRVLQRCKHMLEFAGGPLELTVRDSPGPHSSSPITTSSPGQSVSARLGLTSSQVSVENPLEECFIRQLMLYTRQNMNVENRKKFLLLSQLSLI